MGGLRPARPRAGHAVGDAIAFFLFDVPKVLLLLTGVAGTIPIVEALLGKGLPIGSGLAFMMAVTALSLPEMIILRRVAKPRDRSQRRSSRRGVASAICSPPSSPRTKGDHS